MTNAKICDTIIGWGAGYERPAKRGQMSRCLTDRPCFASVLHCWRTRASNHHFETALRREALLQNTRAGATPQTELAKKSEGVGILAFAQIPLPSKLSIRKFSISFESCPNRDCLALSHFGKNPLKSFFLNLVLLVFPDLINTLYAILIFMQVFFEKKLHLFSTYNLCFFRSTPNDFLKMGLLV